MEEFLKGLALFDQFSAEELERIADLIEVRRFEAGQLVIDPERPAKAVYALRDGAVSVKTRKSDGSQNETLAVLRAGETFGELSLVDRELPSAAVVAQEDSVLYALNHSELLDLMAKDASIANKILWSLVRTLVQRLRETDRSLTVARRLNAGPTSS